MGYLIGCDLGSQSAKAVLLTSDGVVLATATAGYSMDHPQAGWAEQDPADYRSALATAVRKSVSDAGVDAHEVTHLGVASQVDGVVPIDRRLEPLRPAIIWLDRRATPQVARLEKSIGAQRAFELSGLNLDASHTAPKLMWLAENEPDVFRDSAWLPSVGGYVTAWLTGHPIQDHADSSSSLLYDIVGRQWSDELLAVAGIDRTLLPAIGRAQDVAGALTRDAADALGLSTQCQVIVGSGDDHASCLGAGAVRPGIVVDIIGTAEPVGVLSDTPVLDEHRLLETHAHAVDGSYLIENPGFVSGGSTLWFARNVLGVDQSEFFKLAERSVPGARGVRFIPALSGSMTPRWNSGMRGAFSGLGLNHDASDLARAIVEGNAFAFRDIFDRFRSLGLADSVRVVGGGAQSDLWLATKATLCDTGIRRVAGTETTAVGAAMLAGVSAGAFRDVGQAVDAVVRLEPHEIEPDQRHRAQLEHAYAEYREYFDALEPITA